MVVTTPGPFVKGPAQLFVPINNEYLRECEVPEAGRWN